MKKQLGFSLPAVLLGTAVFGQLWATQTRVYLAPDDHTDFIWSGTEAAYTGPSGAFVSMLDYYRIRRTRRRTSAPSTRAASTPTGATGSGSTRGPPARTSGVS